VAGLPGLLGPDRAGRAALARVEALAGWTELLRATLAAAAGLHQAILATAANPPAPIRAQVATLAGRLRQGQPLPAALREFADQLADPTGDLVVAALLLAADRPAADLSELLAALAGNAREQAAMRARVAASRARLRSSARIVTALTLVMVTGLVLLNRQWMQPYATPAGQLVMATAGGLFTLGLVGLARMSQLDGPPRLFDTGARP
jgi:Flp pilus assembly protein TadB